MFWFGPKKRRSVAPKTHVVEQQLPPPTADTFVEATGGGWSDPPEVLPADGGLQADYVGETFTFRLVDIPRGIISPHEIMFGLMMRANDYGLLCGMMHNEEVSLTRID